MEKIFISPRAFAAYGMGHIKDFQDKGYEVIFRDDGKTYEREEFERNAMESTGIIVGTEPLDGELIAKCKKLKYIVRYGVGMDNIDIPAAEKLGIKIDRCAGSNSTSVAEMAVALMFTMAKSLPKGVRTVADQRWDKVNGLQLLGKTIGIVGFGDIGKEIARIAGGIGMKTVACARRPIKKEMLEKYGTESVPFDELIKISDVVSISVPLTDDTRDMITYQQMCQMKNSVIIVNTARGGIVNDKDALRALKEGQIGAYATDVFLPEPPVYEDWVKELLSLDNFILTPHMASRTKEADQNMVNMSAEKMMRMLSER